MGALPPDALKRADVYRERERQFRSGLTPPKGGSDENCGSTKAACVSSA
jgi:hypothetical protein